MPRLSGLQPQDGCAVRYIIWNVYITMRKIPLNLLTLYADLLQNVGLDEIPEGSITIRTVKTIKYVYLTEKVTRRQINLGRADNPDVMERAEVIRHKTEASKSLRATVTALKNAKIPAPSLPLGRVLQAIASAGLFNRGIILVGTAAYQTYSCILGYYLPGSAIMTNDADLLAASFVAGEDALDLEEILQRADPTFKAQMSRNDTLPKVFRASNAFQVDVLTRYGRGRTSPVPIKGLGCAAEALTFMEYLAEDPIDAVALYGTGVPVKVPRPLRYAIHKLLIAQERSGRHVPKKAKDLLQAKDIIGAYQDDNPEELEDELAAARNRGRAWKKNINASLNEIGLTERQQRQAPSTQRKR